MDEIRAMDFYWNHSGLTLNQDKAMKPQTVQIVRQGEVTPYWFKVNPLYLRFKMDSRRCGKEDRADAFCFHLRCFADCCFERCLM